MSDQTPVARATIAWPTTLPARTPAQTPQSRGHAAKVPAPPLPSTEGMTKGIQGRTDTVPPVRTNPIGPTPADMAALQALAGDDQEPNQYESTSEGEEKVKSQWPESSLILIPEITQADRDARFFSVNLPSRFYFYPFKTLTASLITGVQQMKFEKAAREDSTQYAVEAVTSALGDGINAMDLTLPDFYYLMFWLRLASYTKFDFNHVAICRNPKHAQAVVDKKLPATSLKTIATVKSTMIEETQFVPFELSEDLIASGLRMRPAIMADIVALSDGFIRDETGNLSPQAEEDVFLGDYACYLDPVQTSPRWDTSGRGDPLSLRTRIDLVRSMPGDLLREIKQYTEQVSQYGAKEYIKVRCKGCGAEIRTEVRVSASDFL